MRDRVNLAWRTVNPIGDGKNVIRDRINLILRTVNSIRDRKKVIRDRMNLAWRTVNVMFDFTHRDLYKAMRVIAAIAVTCVFAWCATGFIGEPPTEPQLDDHCILHAVVELDDRADRLISQARNAGDMEVRRVADTLAADRSRRRTTLEEWRGIPSRIMRSRVRPAVRRWACR